MAKRNNYRRTGKKTGYKKPSMTKQLNALAYKMGQVQKGLKNPDSQITQSYNNGVNSAKKTKKPLF